MSKLEVVKGKLVFKTLVIVLFLLASVHLDLTLAPAKQWKPNATVFSYGPLAGEAGVDETETIIGEKSTHKVKEGESLLDIARLHHLGYQELIRANSGVDPWVPPVGLEINIPSAWIIPRESYQGFVLNIPEMRLYYYLPNSRIMTFPLGIGMEGWDTPAGKYYIGEKRKDPIWYVPASIQAEMEEPRKFILPGPDNPLGSHWMRLSKTTYGIHGTNNPWAVGRYVTHGCIRLYPEDIAFLFPRVPPKMPVEIIYKHTKVGLKGGKAYFQVFRYRGMEDSVLFMNLIRQVRKLKLAVNLRGMRELLRNAEDGALIPVPLQ